MRKPSFAGLFYPDDKEELNSLITGCFLSELGPGSLPSSADDHLRALKAVIVPHAGYTYSGMAAAFAYKDISESYGSLPPDLFILVGPNHNRCLSCVSSEDFSTPLGVVKTDTVFAELLVSKGSICIDNKAHSFEHSLEVQLPFLQFVFKDCLSKIRILPLMLSSDADISRLSDDLAASLKESGKSAVFIISSDFTHYGRNYSYVPFSSDVKARLHSTDMKSVDLISAHDIFGFKSHVMSTGSTICGFFPILLFLKTVNFKSAKLRKYYTSGDISGDFTNSVSYVSMSFW